MDAAGDGLDVGGPEGDGEGVNESAAEKNKTISKFLELRATRELFI